MADIELKVLGDASGATAAMVETGEAAESAADVAEKAFASLSKKTEAAFREMEKDAAAAAKQVEESMKKMAAEGEAAWKRASDAQAAHEKGLQNLKAGFAIVGAAALKFAADSVKAYAEAEKNSAQLARAAGDNAAAFEAQADALEELLNVDGEVIKQQQTMLLQWGAQPQAIDATVRAIQDYAVATGQDALSATTSIIKAVETGAGKTRELGIEFDSTGNKSKDLASAVEAITGKLGGVAETDAKTLHGSLFAVSAAFEKIQEVFGGTMAQFEAKSGVLDKVAKGMRNIAAGMERGEGFWESYDAMTPGGMLANALLGPSKKAPEVAPIAERQSAAPVFLVGPDGKRATGEESDSRKAQAEKQAAAVKHGEEMWKIAKKNADDLRALMKEEEAFDDEQLSRDEDRRAKEIDGLWKLAAEEQRIEGDRLEAQKAFAKREDDFRLDKEKKSAEHIAKLRKAESDAESKAAEEAVERTKAMEDRSRQAADAIGAAFVNALADQLAKLADGGELDPAIFIGEILAATVGTAATIIGTAYGAPAVGAAIGNLAAMGIRAGASGISKQSKRAKTYHSGGWVGDEIDIPRHHSGAWIGADERAAILQTGERVLSRVEVGAMGGNGAVDAAAEGRRPGVTVNVTALDSKSAAEAFESQVGRGMQRALNSGRGALPALLGGVR